MTNQTRKSVLFNLGTNTTDLGLAPDGLYSKLPPAPGNPTRWYIWNDASGNFTEGNYSMKLFSNSGEMFLDRLEFHKTEHITPVLELAEQEVIVTFPAFITSNKNMDVYLVPEGTMPGDDLESLQLLRMRVVPDISAQLPTNELQPGNYILYGVDKTGAISEGVNLTIIDFPQDMEYDYAEIDGLAIIDTSSLSAPGSWQKASDTVN